MAKLEAERDVNVAPLNSVASRPKSTMPTPQASIEVEAVKLSPDSRTDWADLRWRLAASNVGFSPAKSMASSQAQKRRRRKNRKRVPWKSC
jgi:hypothetical protein